jgi:nucleoside-diphosphate-sugar epimerase
MQTLITGATGFVGWHTAARLAAEGHRVRALVRDAEKGRRLLAPLGLADDDLLLGDMADPAAVARALEGCDAVVHAAAAVSVTEPGLSDAAFDANLRGTQLVVGGACERGIRRVVFVSSLLSILDPGREVSADSPVVEGRTRYGRSKSACERLVRDLQAQGAAVAILYPTGVIGPDDPGLSESVKAFRGFLRTTLASSGGCFFLDVRDLALLIARMLEQGTRGRVVAGGHFLSWDELTALFEEVSGAHISRLRAPGWLLRAAGRVLDGVAVATGRSFPIGFEAMEVAMRARRVADSPEVAALGVRWREPRETLEDMFRWFLASGRVRAAHLPRLAGPAAVGATLPVR